MDVTQIEEAADLIVAMRTQGLVLKALPDRCSPRSSRDAQAIADLVTERLGTPVAGWKIGFSYKSGERPVRTPIYAPLPSGATVSTGASALTLVEAEVVFRLRDDLPPRARRYDYEQVAEALEPAPALEVITPRFAYESQAEMRAAGQKGRGFDGLADHASSGGFVIGEFRPDWRGIDFPRMRTVMTANGTILADVVGGHPLFEPFLPLYVFANLMREDIGLRKGEVLATASLTGSFPAVAGSRVTADFDGLGRVEATFA